MNAKKLRNLFFSLHRYLGLLVGLILIVVGLTGSLLVFKHEIDQWAIQQQFGRVVPQEERVSMDVAINDVVVSPSHKDSTSNRQTNNR